MKATALEYRYRTVLQALVFVLGLFAPWNYVFHTDATGPNAHSWGILAVWISQQRLMNIGVAFELLLYLGIFFATAAAALHTWGTAYRPIRTVGQGSTHPGWIEAGPYRFLRNPLSLAIMLHAVALALLMPRSGVLFCLAMTALLQVRLILAEEALLIANNGPAYEAYRKLVPALLPSFRPRIASSGVQPHWLMAFRLEIYAWGVAGSYAFAGWQFNASLLIRCVLVSMGAALIVQAFLPASEGQTIHSPNTPSQRSSRS